MLEHKLRKHVRHTTWFGSLQCARQVTRYNEAVMTSSELLLGLLTQVLRLRFISRAHIKMLADVAFPLVWYISWNPPFQNCKLGPN